MYGYGMGNFGMMNPYAMSGMSGMYGQYGQMGGAQYGANYGNNYGTPMYAEQYAPAQEVDSYEPAHKPSVAGEVLKLGAVAAAAVGITLLAKGKGKNAAKKLAKEASKFKNFSKEEVLARKEGFDAAKASRLRKEAIARKEADVIRRNAEKFEKAKAKLNIKHEKEMNNLALKEENQTLRETRRTKRQETKGKTLIEGIKDKIAARKEAKALKREARLEAKTKLEAKANQIAQETQAKNETISGIMGGLLQNAEKQEAAKNKALGNLIGGLQQNAKQAEEVTKSVTETTTQTAKKGFFAKWAEKRKLKAAIKEFDKNVKTGTTTSIEETGKKGKAKKAETNPHQITIKPKKTKATVSKKTYTATAEEFKTANIAPEGTPTVQEITSKAQRPRLINNKKGYEKVEIPTTPEKKQGLISRFFENINEKLRLRSAKKAEQRKLDRADKISERIIGQLKQAQTTQAEKIVTNNVETPNYQANVKEFLESHKTIEENVAKAQVQESIVPNNKTVKVAETQTKVDDLNEEIKAFDEVMGVRNAVAEGEKYAQIDADWRTIRNIPNHYNLDKTFKRFGN